MKKHLKQASYLLLLHCTLFFAFIGISAMNSASAQTYHEDDKEGLRIFLRQPSAETGKINAEQLDLQISDTLNWRASEAWVEKIVNLTWNDESPKRLIGNHTNFRGWRWRKLAGTLDASKWSKLTYLYCPYNQLTALNVSENTELTLLDCFDNQLTALDVRENTKLTYLNCSGNQLTALDVRENTALTELYCSSNQLTALDLRENTILTALECCDNQLTALDVRENTKLTELDCNDNQLTALDVSENTELTELDCNDNQLTALDVRENTELDILRCFNNCFPLSELLAVSERLSIPSNKSLGTQNLLPQKVNTGSELFSEQALFKGIYTNYAINKDGAIPASESDYTITAGKITFNNSGSYTVTMTNSAIVSDPDYPAKVIAKIEVVE